MEQSWSSLSRSRFAGAEVTNSLLMISVYMMTCWSLTGSAAEFLLLCPVCSNVLKIILTWHSPLVQETLAAVTWQCVCACVYLCLNGQQCFRAGSVCVCESADLCWPPALSVPRSKVSLLQTVGDSPVAVPVCWHHALFCWEGVVTSGCQRWLWCSKNRKRLCYRGNHSFTFVFSLCLNSFFTF